MSVRDRRLQAAAWWRSFPGAEAFRRRGAAFAVAVLLLASVPARAAPEGSAGGTDDAPADASGVTASAVDWPGRLAEARDAYLLGRVEPATTAFAAILVAWGAPDGPDEATAASAAGFLGEIQWLSGDRLGAEATFRSLLTRLPDHRLSPVDHPVEVLGAFEVVRGTMARVEAAATAPSWGQRLAPFGVPQFAVGHRRHGVAQAVLQGAFAAVSLGSAVALGVGGAAEPAVDDGVEAARVVRLARLRDYVNLPATAAFYGLWAASLLDANLAPSRGTPGLAAAGVGASIAWPLPARVRVAQRRR